MLQLVLFVLILVCMYATMVVPLNLMMGYGGLLSMAPAAFFGIGAYTVAILSTAFHANIFVSLLGMLGVSAAAATIIAVPFLRLRDEYFVIGTLAFQVVAQSVMLNWVDVTKGPMGLSGIPDPEILGIVFSDYQTFVGLAAAFAVAGFASAWRIARSPTAILLRGVRDDEVAVSSLGRDVYRLKVYITVYSAMWMAAGGALFAYLISALDPSPFSITASIFMQSLVIVGGSGNLYGPLIGCFILVPLPEALRFLNVPTSVGAEIRNVTYGLLLVLFMRFRPQGFIGERTMFLRRGGLVATEASAGEGAASGT